MVRCRSAEAPGRESPRLRPDRANALMKPHRTTKRIRRAYRAWSIFRRRLADGERPAPVGGELAGGASQIHGIIPTHGLDPSHHSADMILYRELRQVQPRRNFLVGEAIGYELDKLQ